MARLCRMTVSRLKQLRFLDGLDGPLSDGVSSAEFECGPLSHVGPSFQIRRTAQPAIDLKLEAEPIQDLIDPL